jgi:hypothetical protein
VSLNPFFFFSFAVITATIPFMPWSRSATTGRLVRDRGFSSFVHCIESSLLPSTPPSLPPSSLSSLEEEEEGTKKNDNINSISGGDDDSGSSSSSDWALNVPGPRFTDLEQMELDFYLQNPHMLATDAERKYGLDYSRLIEPYSEAVRIHDLVCKMCDDHVLAKDFDWNVSVMQKQIELISCYVNKESDGDFCGASADDEDFVMALYNRKLISSRAITDLMLAI